ncbi:uncharacterized protein LOC131151071 isoform X2 [Malania oleifera]|uniref:uncharacterized protein LOC131151071 isoform X2 n=1 Tax=Malania oleifera TaxID=397392 RepID=UPI0025AEA136|nr:uncharacterized protein LOC131151071 isoform X2 [Malania oleifera]
MRASFWAGDSNNASTSSAPPRIPQAVSGQPSTRRSNIIPLLVRREVSPRVSRSSKRLWGKASKCHVAFYGTKFESQGDPRVGLISWVEAESLQHLSAEYCTLLPSPRSTIAAAFSPDGKTLASTHGDHTVKIIDCQTGRCLKVLTGHRRTPWVARFHPLYPEILASGSLDHEVCLWNANTAECIGSRDFYRPIASIAFHAHGELLAVASGHKLYIWHYSRRDEMSRPTIVLKTRRSLRAVHFHPYAAPFLLTAEVNDLDSSDSPMTFATSSGYLCYPPPTVYVADAHSTSRSRLTDEPPLIPLPVLTWLSSAGDDGRMISQHTDRTVGSSDAQQRVDTSASVRLLTYSTPSGQYELLLSPVEPSSSSPVPEETGSSSFLGEVENAHSRSAMDAMEVQPEESSNQFFSFGDPMHWELPFLQGWLMGRSQANQRPTHLLGGVQGNSFAFSEVEFPAVIGSSVASATVGQPSITGRRHHSSHSRIISTTVPLEGANVVQDENDPQSATGRNHSEFATSLAAAAAAAAELPCTVKLRVWHHDVKNPCASLDEERCRLTIPHAVLCSEMGAHFSPCGRFLAACVTCMLPHLEADPGLHGMMHHDTGTATSPTRHPISGHQVIFGLVLASRAIRAAHCLTSIQFSPTSEHLLLAYGRRHGSLLKSVLIDGETAVPIYTILEVYRVSDMELVRVLPSAEDEVNVACFHPSVGGGLVYGTKEGKLRILQYDSSHGIAHVSSSYLDENRVPTYALEC